MQGTGLPALRVIKGRRGKTRQQRQAGRAYRVPPVRMRNFLAGAQSRKVVWTSGELARNRLVRQHAADISLHFLAVYAAMVAHAKQCAEQKALHGAGQSRRGKMKMTAKAITTTALAAAMAIPVAVAIPTSADAQRLGIPSEAYVRYHNCRVSGKPGWYCRMTDSEQRAHDEKVRREAEARREAERRAAEERRRQKEREAQERRSRAAQEYLEYQLRSGDSCRFGGC